MRSGLTELTQKAQVVVEEHAQVIDAVAQHRHSLNPQAKRKAAVFFGIDATVLEHLGVHHAATHDFKPFDTAVLFPAPLDIHLSGRLRKREVGRPETNLEIPLEKHPQELFNGAFEIGKADVTLHQQTLDLM